MSELERKILEIVRRNNGCFSWYQIDRALSETGSQHSGKLMRILGSLVESGTIDERQGANPAQPLYEITPLGLESLKVLSELESEAAGQ
ncbi:hypothetical protein SH501x_002544 [Pirellulaceae bacterium SH501]